MSKGSVCLCLCLALSLPFPASLCLSLVSPSHLPYRRPAAPPPRQSARGGVLRAWAGPPPTPPQSPPHPACCVDTAPRWGSTSRGGLGVPDCERELRRCLVAHGRRDNSEGDAAACVFAYEWGARRDVRGESSADRCVSVCERVYCNEVTSWSSARFPFCGCPLVMKVEGFVDDVLSSFKWSLGADPNPSCEEVCAGPCVCVATTPSALTSPSRVGGRPRPHNGKRLFAA